MAASLLAGCGNSSKPAESTPAEPAAPAATEEAKEETPADTTAETTADAGAADYSDVTLTFWSMWNSTEPQGKVIQEAADAGNILVNGKAVKLPMLLKSRQALP